MRVESGADVSVGGADTVLLAIASHTSAIVRLSPSEARIVARELLRVADERLGLTEASLRPVGVDTSRRADGSAFDPHATGKAGAGALMCTRQGCAHVYELHESGRCTARVSDPRNAAAGNYAWSACGCLGFQGDAPATLGHVPVSAR